jgi:hypothetical protein
MEDLYCHIGRSELITKVLVKYAKANFEVLDLNCEEAKDLNVISPKFTKVTAAAPVTLYSESSVIV